MPFVDQLQYSRSVQPLIFSCSLPPSGANYPQTSIICSLPLMWKISQPDSAPLVWLLFPFSPFLRSSLKLCHFSFNFLLRISLLAGKREEMARQVKTGQVKGTFLP